MDLTGEMCVDQTAEVLKHAVEYVVAQIYKHIVGHGGDENVLIAQFS